ncbi:MAG TPA: methyl-accepting chemotaxis protein [Clostridia bacterium]|nr:methyl-accepting chemotaxis protein [Clostridia bacterium]
MLRIFKRKKSSTKEKKEKPVLEKNKGMFQWFVNMKIFGKIFVLAIILLFFLVAMGVYSLSVMAELNKNAENIYKEQMTRIRLLAEIRHYTALNSLSVTEHTTTIDPVRLQLVESEIEKNRDTIDQLIEEYQSMEQDENEQKLIEGFEMVLAEYRASIAEILKYSRAKEKEEAQMKNRMVAGQKNRTFIAIENLMDYDQNMAEKAYLNSQKMFASTTANFTMVLITALIISLLLALLIGRSLGRRLGILEKAARQIAGGDLTVNWDTASKDEIGSLSASLGLMLSNLRQLIQNVQDSATQTASASEELSASTAEAQKTVEQVTAAIQEVASGANEQASGAQNTAELAEMIKEATISSNQMVEVMSKISGQARDLVMDGLQTLENQNEKMQDNAAASEKVAAVIDDLSKRAAEVGQILETITGFAAQTNLLALNAAIEAARAGEQGRGFAVVAEEVRKLAEGSAQAAEEIGSIVEKIQSGAAEAVEEMGRTMTAVKAQREAVRLTDGVFRNISRAVEEIADSTEKVAAASSEIKGDAENIAETIQNIASVAESNAASAEEVSAGSQEQSAAIEEIANLAEALAQLGQRLQGAVQEFKL